MRRRTRPPSSRDGWVLVCLWVGERGSRGWLSSPLGHPGLPPVPSLLRFLLRRSQRPTSFGATVADPESKSAFYHQDDLILGGVGVQRREQASLEWSLPTGLSRGPRGLSSFKRLLVLT